MKPSQTKAPPPPLAGEGDGGGEIETKRGREGIPEKVCAFAEERRSAIIAKEKKERELEEKSGRSVRSHGRLWIRANGKGPEAALRRQMEKMVRPPKGTV